MIRFFLAVAPGILLALFLSLDHTRYQLDDALIYARYIRNALESQGLVYNPNEYWNALSSPLYGVLLLGSAHIFADVLTAQHALSILLLCTSIISGAALLRIIGASYTCAGAFSLLIASSQYFYTIFGMESFLFATLLFTSLSLYQLISRHPDSVPLYLGLALALSLTLLVLTRGEGIFVVFILAGYHFLSKRPLPNPALWIIPIGGATLFVTIHYRLYGDLLPETFSAKMAQGSSGFWGGHLAFLKGVKMYTWYFGKAISIPFTLSLFLILTTLFYYRKAIAIASCAGYLCLLVVFYTSLKIPFYHWYYAPILYFGYFLLALSPQLASLLNKISPRAVKISKTLVLCVLCAFTYFQYTTTRGFVNSKYHSPYKTIGQWIEKNTSKESKVASVEVGALGWYAKRYIIDILGLTSPLNAHFLAQKKLRKWTEHYDPDYMVIHEPLWPQEMAANMYLKRGARKITRGIPEGFAILEIKRFSTKQVLEED